MYLPVASLLEYPYNFSAAGFQLVILPWSVLPMMASSEYSTIASMSPAFSTACCRAVTSSTPVITNNTSPVSIWDKLTLIRNSPPMRWRPLSSTSSPLERVRGSAK